MTKKRVQQIAPVMPGKKYLLLFLGGLLLILYLSLEQNAYYNPASSGSPYAKNYNPAISGTDIVAQANGSGGSNQTAANKPLTGERALDQLGLTSCALEKSGNFSRSGRENLVVTASVELPMLGWLNSANPNGTDQSQFTPPCVVELREDWSGQVNWTKQYSIQSGLQFGNTNGMFATPGNGSVCIYNDFRTFGQQQVITPAQLSSQYNLKYQSSKETSENKKNLAEKFIGGLLRRSNQPKSYEYDINKCSGTEKIDSLFVGDVLTSTAESVVKAEDQEANLTDELKTMTLGLLGGGMATAYREQLYEMNWAGYGCTRVIYRNNAGIKARVKLNYYQDDNSSKLTAGEEYKDKGRKLGDETYEFYFPWADSIRRSYNYLSNYFGDYSPERSNFRQRSYYKLYTTAANQVNQGNLSSEVGGFGFSAKKPFDQIDRMLRDTDHLFYCSDIDSLKATLASKFNDNRDAQALTKLINRTDCIDESQCVNQPGDGGAAQPDPWQRYLCEKGFLKGELCSTVSPRDPTAGEPLICEEAKDASQLPADLPQTAPPSTPTPPPSSGSNNKVSSPIDRGSRTQTFSLGHPGMDWGVLVGSPVKAITSGRVIYAGRATAASQQQYSLFASPNGGYGNVVFVKHGNYCAVYAHLSAIRVNEGQTVSQGQLVGLSGNTGNSTGPHLHFELRKHCGPVAAYAHRNSTAQAQDYLDPSCLFYGNCQFEINDQTPQEPSPSDFTELPTIPTKCEVNPAAEPTDFDPNSIKGPISDIRQVINVEKCGGASSSLITNGNTPDALALINMSLQAQPSEGTVGETSIYQLAKKVAAATCVPAEKLLAHLHIERYGVGEGSISSDVPKKYNGRVDQVALAKPNICGCIGPGQFCPNTAKGYFMPSGKGYAKTYECSVQVGLKIKYGDPIPAHQVGSALCAMAVKLKAHTKLGDTQCQAWRDQPSCQNATNEYILANPTLCPNRAATRGYFGSCEGSAGKRYCDFTSDYGATNSLLTKYQTILQGD